VPIGPDQPIFDDTWKPPIVKIVNQRHATPRAPRWRRIQRDGRALPSECSRQGSSYTPPQPSAALRWRSKMHVLWWSPTTWPEAEAPHARSMGRRWSAVAVRQGSSVMVPLLQPETACIGIDGDQGRGLRRREKATWLEVAGKWQRLAKEAARANRHSNRRRGPDRSSSFILNGLKAKLMDDASKRTIARVRCQHVVR
jgi:hypothetical protein